MPHTADREHGDRAARGVDADEEIVGLDINEHGERGYLQQTL